MKRAVILFMAASFLFMNVNPAWCAAKTRPAHEHGPRHRIRITLPKPKKGAARSDAAAVKQVSGIVAVTVTVNKTIAWVNFYLDGVYEASSPPYTWRWDSTKSSNGKHTLLVNAYATNNSLAGQASLPVDVENNGALPEPTPEPKPTSTPAPAPSSKPTSAPTVTPAPKPSSTPSSKPTATPAPSNPSQGPSISGLTGDTSGLSGNPDTNIADYGNYPYQGDGMGLLGGPLLNDQQAASLVKPTAKSSVETGSHAAANAAANNYFASEAASNPNDYLNQVNSFYSEWSPGDWGGAAERIDGACPMTNPTTAEIGQWAANKWGVNPLLMYAEAVQEGDWDNTSLGDNGTSSGVWQVADRGSSHAFAGFAGAGANLARENTCFDADFYAAHLWASFHGYTGETSGGDVGTAIQTWFSGSASGPGSYTSEVYGHLSNRDWESDYFGGATVPY